MYIYTYVQIFLSFSFFRCNSTHSLFNTHIYFFVYHIQQKVKMLYSNLKSLINNFSNNEKGHDVNFFKYLC